MPNQWGLTRPMCEASLKYLMDWIKKDYHSIQDGYQRDYAKVYSLFLDRPLVADVLGRLDASISANATTASSETNWLRLSSVLAHFENKCWFPTDMLLPMGILSSDHFYYYIRRGYVLKDYGAGVKHGEFTHRLQWHVIMGVITRDFTIPRDTSGWDHTPLQLYCSLGKKTNEGVWGRLFDTRGEGGFSHPDSFHAWLLNSTVLGTLKGMLAHRETKRRIEFVQNIIDYIQNELNTKRGLGIIYPAQFSSTLNPFHSHDGFKEFEKWFVNSILRKTFNEPDVKIVYDGLTAKDEPAYQQKKTAPIHTLTTAPKHRTSPYVSTGVGSVYKISTNALMSENDADNRALKSRGTLL